MTKNGAILIVHRSMEQALMSMSAPARLAVNHALTDVQEHHHHLSPPRHLSCTKVGEWAISARAAQQCARTAS